MAPVSWTMGHAVLRPSQYVGGFKGEWQKAPSGVNQAMKLELLAEEGVEFDAKGKLLDAGRIWMAFED